MTLLDDDLRAELQAAARRMELLETLRQDRPSEFYEPHDRGQAQFHAAPHIVRALFPGNGFGKTRAAGTEANWWLTHCHPFQTTPEWPCIVIWCCETFKQFKILRPQLEEECFDRPWKFNKSDHCNTPHFLGARLRWIRFTIEVDNASDFVNLTFAHEATHRILHLLDNQNLEDSDGDGVPDAWEQAVPGMRWEAEDLPIHWMTRMRS